MNSISTAVENFLNSANLVYHQREDDDEVYVFNFTGFSGSFNTYILVNEEGHTLAAHAQCPVCIPAQRLTETTELVARINWDLAVSSFDIEMEGGLIVCRTAVEIGDCELDDEVVKHVITRSLITMDAFLPAVVAVAYGDISPREAIEELRLNVSSDDQQPRCTGF